MDHQEIDEIAVGLLEQFGGEHDGSLIAFIGAMTLEGERFAIPIPTEHLPAVIRQLQGALRDIRQQKEALKSGM